MAPSLLPHVLGSFLAKLTHDKPNSNTSSRLRPSCCMGLLLLLLLVRVLLQMLLSLLQQCLGDLIVPSRP